MSPDVGHHASDLALAYASDETAAAPAAMIVALHDEGGDCDQLRPMFKPLNGDFHLYFPQAWRSVVPQHFGQVSSGFSWYFQFPGDRPEPATFGDSLAQIEQCIEVLAERQNLPIILFGYGQGACLANVLAALMPDRITGLVAVNGYLPRIRGWSLPLLEKNLPVLALRESACVFPDRALWQASAAFFPSAQAVDDVTDVTAVSNTWLRNAL